MAEGGFAEEELSPHKPILENGVFRNPWDTWKDPAPTNVLKWSLTSKNNTNLPGSKEELNDELPIEQWDKEKISKPPKPGTMRVTWIGHATVLVQMDNFSFLTDPVFSKRCAPLQAVGTKSTKRFRDAPCTIAELPEIDAVLISHNHYDHLDSNSVYDLNQRFGEKLHWFVPLKLGSWFESSGCKTIHELNWWDEIKVEGKPDLKVVFTPAQHWSTRCLIDKNKTLWGSWCVIGKHQKFYFAGDTGYCDVFKIIGRKYGPFDLAAIPIGAYEPRWFMKYQHVDPEEAVEIHKDIKAKKSIGVHWGTFALANEFYLEPPKKLEEAMAAQNLRQGDFFVLNHGASRDVSCKIEEDIHTVGPGGEDEVINTVGPGWEEVGIHTVGPGGEAPNTHE